MFGGFASFGSFASFGLQHQYLAPPESESSSSDEEEARENDLRQLLALEAQPALVGGRR